jgi:hypothetical protein
LTGLLDSALSKVNKFIADRRSEGSSLFKSIQVDKPKREQERLREDLSRLNLNYGNKPPPPIPGQPIRTPSIPLSGNYTYPSPQQQQPTYSFSPPPRPSQPQSPGGYPSPQSPYGYPPQAPPPSQYGAPQQGQYGIGPPMQPKPGYRSPPPPGQQGQGQGQGGYGYRSPY